MASGRTALGTTALGTTAGRGIAQPIARMPGRHGTPMVIGTVRPAVARTMTRTVRGAAAVAPVGTRPTPIDLHDPSVPIRRQTCGGTTMMQVWAHS
jgi:hypothetical protein